METYIQNNSFYHSVHYWLKVKYGPANRCENKKCPGVSKRFEWAKKKEKSYDYNIKNFLQLCKSCHIKYDLTENTKIKMRNSSRNTHKTHCKKGHEYNKENTYNFLNPNGKPARNCKKCMYINHLNWVNKNKN